VLAREIIKKRMLNPQTEGKLVTNIRDTMYDHPLDNKLLIRTDQLERILDDAATPQVTPCLGYPKCDGDLPGEKHEAECPAFEGTSEQASPTPDKCPRCGSKDYWTALPACHGGIADSWHSSAATQTEK
jgi:hypothetical protein